MEKKNKTIKFTFTNKQKIGAIITTAALVIGVLSVKSCHDSKLAAEKEATYEENKAKIERMLEENITSEDISNLNIDEAIKTVEAKKNIKNSDIKQGYGVYPNENNNSNANQPGDSGNSIVIPGNNGEDIIIPIPDIKPDPEKPDKPKPDKPDKPKPDQPDPEKPDKPDQPDPEKPDQPDQPDPEKPDQPDQPDPEKPHVHNLVSNYEAHDENETCVITRWQVCTDPKCPNGAGTHLNQTVSRQSHSYTPIAEIENPAGSGIWIITDICTVCNHTQDRFVISGLSSYSMEDTTEEYAGKQKTYTLR